MQKTSPVLSAATSTAKITRADSGDRRSDDTDDIDKQPDYSDTRWSDDGEAVEESIEAMSEQEQAIVHDRGIVQISWFHAKAKVWSHVSADSAVACRK